MWHPYYYSTDDLIGDLGCYAWGMARTHDGLMMLLTVGRNHALRLVLFNDVISLWWLDVSCMLLVSSIFLYFVSWIRWWWCIFISMYILLAFHTLWHVQWMIVHSWFHLPWGFRDKCILWTLDFSLFFHVDVVVVRLRIN